ncbi:MAG: hypothetical protein A3C72_01040 [Candidatus Taylorbacteria bacterium RIFCSPHIGHO2_02_FULL_43_32b]|uniref:Polymerase nucleotidyl transferase domain-containing protein n=1 Tax=Candidatus Taylorbacteria bacterium RIFCSPHIGHO2_02_FULL_43_32b TaxID=1802306 RepID=A0A1G2MDG9_9BACT|nr:MAG: hypothetical protein A3C72_01040 [Candidatus Taylorbacteria bacterium RIFCSPHIGHO2_02_FULL_43_32b]
MNKNVIKICKSFIKEILEKEDWFRQLVNDKACDLLLLTGTATEQTKDVFSDIDIFLVCKYDAQVKYSLKPVQIYKHKGEVFEISILSTEKLFNDKYHKESIHWWHHTYIIKSYNKEAVKALSRASRLTKKEFLDRLWTNFVYFKINTADIEKQIKRKEPLSVKLLFNENIKLVIDSELVCNGEFPSWKQFGRVLQRIDKNLYGKILEVQNFNDFKELWDNNTQLQSHIIKILKDNGFPIDEINNWENCNLERITFQYR